MRRRKKFTLPVLGAILVALAGSWIVDKVTTEPRPTCLTRFGYACAYSKQDLEKARGADFTALVRLQSEGAILPLEQSREATVMETDGKNCKAALPEGLVVWTLCEALDCPK